MKSITIDGIDDELAQALESAAERERTSVDQVVVELLRERFGLARGMDTGRRHHDLDGLFGRWSDEEFEQIQGAVNEQRDIDAYLWR